MKKLYKISFTKYFFEEEGRRGGGGVRAIIGGQFSWGGNFPGDNFPGGLISGG